MEIKIGANIKRLRREKGVTQEQLAEIMNVSSAAISKWETGETYPDITLIFPLSHYFNVSVDELMGYDASLIEEEIKAVISKYQELRRDYQYDEANALIKVARRKYPNDFRIMRHFIFEISGGLADNDPQVIRNNAEEINKVCDTILKGCDDETIRLEAMTMKAKVLHAQGDTKAALALLNTFPSFYHSSGQRIEQLYAKDTDEFYYQLSINMYELASFTANKLSKAIFYDKRLTNKMKQEKVLKIGKALQAYYNDSDYDVFIIQAESFWGECLGKATILGYDKEFILYCCENKITVSRQLDKLIFENDALRTYLDPNKVIKKQGDYSKNTINGLEKYLQGYLPKLIEKDNRILERLKAF